nr:IS21-like element helper ATPase IstB [Agrococcus sp. KRD186]
MTGAPVTNDDIITAGRAISLTTTVVADWATRGTPKQREYLHGFLAAEHASRQHARHVRLLRAARLPALKSLDGYDWSAIRFPDGYGREQLTDLEFLQHAGDLVFYGDVGTGKTHLACALIAAACQRGIPARFHTTASLVAQLRRAKDADRLDKELAAIARYPLLAIDEFGYLPIDAEGARLLFQVIADAYEKRSLILTTNLEFARWGTVFGDDQMAAAVIDRIVHHGRLLQFRGESYRVAHALMK